MDNNKPKPSGGGEGGGGGGKNSGGRNNHSRNRRGKGKRSRRNRENSRRSGGNKGGSNNKRNKGPPPPPQTKIVIRNICDVNKYGTVKGVVDLIKSIIAGANQKMVAATSRTIQLDEPSTALLIKEEEAAKKAKEEAENMKNESTVHEHDNPDNGSIAEKEESKEADNTDQVETVALSTDHGDASTTSLGARLVYVVPPKQTRRRGIKPGCAYLVITGPRIEVKELPPALLALTEPNRSKEGMEDNKVKSDEQKHESEEAAEDASNGSNVEAKLFNEGENHVTIVEPLTKDSASAALASAPLITIDYSREVAIGRYLIVQAIEILVSHTLDDAKTEQKYAGSKVEIALSGKTYKHNAQRRDRREGTIEQTGDFKSFIEKAAKDKEERLARPKPTPGGGTAAMSTAETTEDGQPIAALVAHIRSKRADAAKRKKAKKKAKDAGKEKSNSTTGKSSRKKKGKDGAIKDNDGKKRIRKKDGKGKGKRSGNKKKRSNAAVNNPSSGNNPTPTLLKPTSAKAPTAVMSTQRAAPPGYG